ncbi:MAG: thymidine kinase [Bacteroidia bacterium]
MQTTPPHYKSDKGWIEVICGSMFSGKTEELLRRVRRAQHAKIKCIIFKPEIDDRYGSDRVQSHDSNFEKCIPIKKASDIHIHLDGHQLIAIDEVQFLDEEIIEISRSLADQNKQVLLAGLDMDANRKPFGYMPALMAQAEHLTKLHAVCSNCGSLAGFTVRLSNVKAQVQVGGKEQYDALCRACYLQRSKK